MLSEPVERAENNPDDVIYNVIYGTVTTWSIVTNTGM